MPAAQPLRPSGDLPIASEPKAFRTQKEVHRVTRARAPWLWAELCKLVLPFSPVLQAIAGTSYPIFMRDRLVAKYADSTLLKYIPQLSFFLPCLSDIYLDVSVESCSMVVLIDILSSLDEQQDQSELEDSFSGNSIIKALRWCCNLLDFHCPICIHPPSLA